MRTLKSPADRTKAKRIRQAIEDGEEISEDDEAWLAHYERTQRGGKNGRSASKRLVHIEEEAAAEGDHVHPEVAAAMVRAEGMRADTLFRLQSEAWVAINTQMLEIFKVLTTRTVRIEEATASLLEAVRDSHLARTKAEGEAIKLQMQAQMQGDDDDDEFVKIMKVVGAAREAVGKETPGERAKRKGNRKGSKPMGAVDQG